MSTPSTDSTSAEQTEKLKFKNAVIRHKALVWFNLKDVNVFLGFEKDKRWRKTLTGPNDTKLFPCVCENGKMRSVKYVSKQKLSVVLNKSTRLARRQWLYKKIFNVDMTLPPKAPPRHDAPPPILQLWHHILDDKQRRRMKENGLFSQLCGQYPELIKVARLRYKMVYHCTHANNALKTPTEWTQVWAYFNEMTGEWHLNLHDLCVQYGVTLSYRNEPLGITTKVYERMVDPLADEWPTVQGRFFPQRYYDWLYSQRTNDTEETAECHDAIQAMFLKTGTHTFKARHPDELCEGTETVTATEAS